jgi:hypothetical protein
MQMPNWERDPEPLAGWTLQEQRVLITELNERPIARLDADALQTMCLSVQRTLPHKSLAEIQACYRHLEVMRIAFFWPSASRRTPVGVLPKSRLSPRRDSHDAPRRNSCDAP